MKTLVVAEVQSGLVALYLNDLALTPQRGGSYVYANQRYEIINAIEYLGNTDETGKKVSGNEKLLTVLKVAYGDEMVAMSLLAKMKSIGSNAPSETKSKGGIIVPADKTKVDFDHVVFLKLRANVLPEPVQSIQAMGPEVVQDENVMDHSPARAALDKLAAGS